MQSCNASDIDRLRRWLTGGDEALGEGLGHHARPEEADASAYGSHCCVSSVRMEEFVPAEASPIPQRMIEVPCLVFSWTRQLQCEAPKTLTHRVRPSRLDKGNPSSTRPSDISLLSSFSSSLPLPAVPQPPRYGRHGLRIKHPRTADRLQQANFRSRCRKEGENSIAFVQFWKLGRAMDFLLQMGERTC